MQLRRTKSAIAALGAEPPPVDVVVVSRLPRRRDRMGKVKRVGGRSEGVEAEE